MNAPPPPPPDIGSARRWRAIALALAVVCAFLSGLLIITVAGDSTSRAADAGAEAGQQDAGAAEEVEVVDKRGRIEGTVTLSGKPPDMPVSRRWKTAEFCSARAVPANAVQVKGGALKDVLVRIENGGAKGDYAPPDAHVIFAHAGCMLAPRVQGAMIGQELEVRNLDPVNHDVHAYRGKETWFNKLEPKGREPSTETIDASGIFKLTCDVHPWERAFLVVSDHPYFAVTGEDGAFTIPDVPVGRYALEVWHPRYGQRKLQVDVTADKPVAVRVTYEATDPEPDINKGELGAGY